MIVLFIIQRPQLIPTTIQKNAMQVALALLI